MNPTPEGRDPPHQEGTQNLAFLTEPHTGHQRLPEGRFSSRLSPRLRTWAAARSPDPEGPRGSCSQLSRDF